jgi:hypothetical protein
MSSFFITDETNELILELNKKLNEKCPDLKLSISKFGDGFKLCLNLNNNICVSELFINANENLNIFSETQTEYRGKGYNKFLTAVCIYLADTITPTHNILYSSTIVEARIHILSEYEHDINNSDYKEDRLGDKPASNFFVPINENNKTKAKKIIDEWIENQCVKTATGEIETTVGIKRKKIGGKKTRRNKQIRKSKKKHKTKRLYIKNTRKICSKE